MKGQFMLISSILAGLIIISLSSVISTANSQEFDNKDTALQIENIKAEAAKVDLSSPQERDQFERLVDYTDYSTTVDYWQPEQCFNVTLIKPDERHELDCIS